VENVNVFGKKGNSLIILFNPCGFYGALLPMSTVWVRLLFWLYLIFLVWAEATSANPADPDLWHRLALGETLWQSHHFPTGVSSSYLADYTEVADHEWGSAVLFYALYRWQGLDTFVVVKLMTLALTMVLLVCAGLRGRQASMLSAAFYALVLWALLPSFLSTVRCMTFTHAFFALWLYWFQRERHGQSVPTYCYVATMLIWANLHGGFVIGLAWLLVVGTVEFASSGPWRKWAVRFGCCFLITLVNPFGVQLWISTGRALLSPRHGFPEWGRVPWLHDVIAYPGYKVMFIGFLVALAVLIYRRGWKQVDRPLVVLLGIFMVLSVTSARHTSLFALVVGALAPDLFPRGLTVESIADPVRRLGYIALCFTLMLAPLYSAMVLTSVASDGLQLRYDPVSCPVESVAYLQRQKITGRLLVPFNYGSYALWELRGRMRVSMDGRYDLVYRPETYERVNDFFAAELDWRSLLTSPAPDAILVPIADAVYVRLKKEPGWTEAFRDSTNTDAVFLPRVK